LPMWQIEIDVLEIIHRDAAQLDGSIAHGSARGRWFVKEGGSPRLDPPYE
jgi:hypothetical protein